MSVNQKYSRKREAILRFMHASGEHPSAEDVYSSLKQEFPDLSLGTVYRNLSKFKETGQIISVGSINGQERFDAKTHTHAHFVCESCGRVLDVNVPDLPEFVCDEAAADVCGKVTGYTLTFYGRCDTCSKDRAYPAG